MIAYHGDHEIKARYLARVAAHRAADKLIQGIGWKHGRGCAVGCTLNTYNHNRYPTDLGIPVKLAYLEDAIFEALSKLEAMTWPERFLCAIPVGADLCSVWPQFAIWLLSDENHGVIRHTRDDTIRSAILAVADLYRNHIPHDDPSWTAASNVARDAAWNAAWAAGSAMTKTVEDIRITTPAVNTAWYAADAAWDATSPALAAGAAVNAARGAAGAAASATWNVASDATARDAAGAALVAASCGAVDAASTVSDAASAVRYAISAATMAAREADYAASDAAARAAGYAAATTQAAHLLSLLAATGAS